MRVLVTGAAGFLGSTLSEALVSQGHDVVGLDCFTDYYLRAIKERNLRALRGNPRFTFHEQDMMTADWARCLEGVSVVYHQAAQAGVRASWGREFAHYTDWNILATQQLLEAVRHMAKPARVVYASSSSVYGERQEFPMRESDLPRPVSPYGVSKLAAEHLCVLYTHNFGVETISLRYFTVYGPRQRPDMAFHKFLRAIYTGGELPMFGDGEQTRDFTYVDDAVRANLAAGQAGTPGGVYNVGGGSRVTLKHCFDVMQRVTGREVRIKRLPRQDGDVTHTGADTQRAAAELGWSPAVSLEQGLDREAEYIRQLLTEGL